MVEPVTLRMTSRSSMILGLGVSTGHNWNLESTPMEGLELTD